MHVMHSKGKKLSKLHFKGKLRIAKKEFLDNLVCLAPIICKLGLVLVISKHS